MLSHLIQQRQDEYDEEKQRNQTIKKLIEEVESFKNAKIIKCPLENALKHGLVKLLKIYIENGLDVNMKLHNGLNSLDYWALNCCCNAKVIFRMLLDSGAKLDMNGPTGVRILKRAINNPHTLRVLIEMGFDVNSNIENTSLLELASYAGEVNSVRLLINKGADMEPIVLKNGATLLMKFTCHTRNSMRIYQYLIDAGANIEARNLHGRTPFMQAIYDIDLMKVKLLLEQGANSNTLDIKLLTATQEEFSNVYERRSRHMLEWDFENMYFSIGGLIWIGDAYDNMLKINQLLILYYLLYNSKTEKPSYIIKEEILSKFWDDSVCQVNELQTHYLGESCISLRDYLCEHDVNKLVYYLDNDTSLPQHKALECIEDYYGYYKKKRQNPNKLIVSDHDYNFSLYYYPRKWKTINPNELCDDDVNVPFYVPDKMKRKKIKLSNGVYRPLFYGPYEEMIEEKLAKGRDRRHLMMENIETMNKCNLKCLSTEIKTRLVAMQSEKDMRDFIDMKYRTNNQAY